MSLKRKERSSSQSYYEQHMEMMISQLHTTECLRTHFRRITALYFQLIYPFVEEGIQQRQQKKNGVSCDNVVIQIIRERNGNNTYDVFEHLHLLKTLWKQSLRPEIGILMLPCIACSKVSSKAICYFVHFDITCHLCMKPESNVYLFPMVATKPMFLFHLKNLFFETTITLLASSYLDWIPRNCKMTILRWIEKDDD
jgi:hypothetical protein